MKKNIFLKIKDFYFSIKTNLKICFYIIGLCRSYIQKLVFFLETKIGDVIPPLRYWYNFRNDYLKYELKEKAVFTKHMPKWYGIYENSRIFIILRILTYIWYALSIRGLLADMFEVYFDIDANEYGILYIIELIILLIFFCNLTLKFILRIIYIKELVYNSPFNYKQAAYATLKSIAYPVLTTTVLGSGVHMIDEIAVVHGFVPPFRHYSDSMSYYMSERVTRPLGTESLDKYELIEESKNPVKNFLRNEQIKSVEKRHEMMALYERQEQGKSMLAKSKAARLQE